MIINMWNDNEIEKKVSGLVDPEDVLVWKPKKKDLIEWFEHKFSNQLNGRIKKILEESQELANAYLDIMNPDLTVTKGLLFDHLDDEICDLYGVLIHLMHMRNISEESAISNVYDKLIKRTTDPNYKKFK